jgi:hypothetical protein
MASMAPVRFPPNPDALATAFPSCSETVIDGVPVMAHRLPTVKLSRLPVTGSFTVATPASELAAACPVPPGSEFPHPLNCQLL